jgi:hypothetical protein
MFTTPSSSPVIRAPSLIIGISKKYCECFTSKDCCHPHPQNHLLFLNHIWNGALDYPVCPDMIGSISLQNF